MKTMFTVEGPFNVPFYQGSGGRTITDENVRDFWKSFPTFAERRGCYIFGVRAGKGLTPGYVGKATKSFRSEVFAHHKLSRYQQFLADYRRGTPIMFFIVAPRKKGVPNSGHIKELEEFLIQNGIVANPELLNIKGTKVEEWGIGGVIRGGKGKPSARARSFKTLMKLS